MPVTETTEPSLNVCDAVPPAKLPSYILSVLPLTSTSVPFDSILVVAAVTLVAIGISPHIFPPDAPSVQAPSCSARQPIERANQHAIPQTPGGAAGRHTLKQIDPPKDI